MRRVAYAALLALGFVFWLVGWASFGAVALLSALGDRVAPGIMTGNCWSHALARFARRGGYLIVRPADDVRLFWGIRIPHAMWAHDLPEDMDLEQFVPVDRSKSRGIPWRTVWFKGELRSRDRSHPSNWGGL